MQKSEIAKKILLAVAAAGAVGGLAIALAVAPGLGFILKPLADWYRSQDRYGKYRIRKTFKQLRRERLIEFTEKDGETRIVLTESGKIRVLKYQIEDLKIPKMKKWDKKWRFVFFDVPQKFSKARDALRRKLKDLGFYQIQKSVWIYPYDCRNEIDFLTEYFRVSGYVRVAEVIKFDGQGELKEKFELR
jgi:DNA-binding transcriptional regulator PaaX